MPNTRIEIENVNNAFHAEVEFGGITAFRRMVNSRDFGGCLREVAILYREHGQPSEEERRFLDHIISGPSPVPGVPQVMTAPTNTLAASAEPGKQRKKPGPKPKNQQPIAA